MAPMLKRLCSLKSSPLNSQSMTIMVSRVGPIGFEPMTTSALRPGCSSQVCEELSYKTCASSDCFWHSNQAELRAHWEDWCLAFFFNVAV